MIDLFQAFVCLRDIRRQYVKVNNFELFQMETEGCTEIPNYSEMKCETKQLNHIMIMYLHWKQGYIV